MMGINYNDSTNAVLLVDASNTLNCLNRQISLHNIQTLCPLLTNILINTYIGKMFFCLLMVEISFPQRGLYEG